MQNAFRILRKFKKSIEYFKELKYLQKTHGAVKFRGIAYCEFAYIEYRVLRIIAVLAGQSRAVSRCHFMEPIPATVERNG